MKPPFEFVDEEKLAQGLSRHQAIFIALGQLGLSKEWIIKIAQWTDDLISAVVARDLIEIYESKTIQESTIAHVRMICEDRKEKWNDPAAKAMMDSYYESLETKSAAN